MKQVGEIDAPQRKANRRHDDIIDQRFHDQPE
jgi:hypothetical protein